MKTIRSLSGKVSVALQQRVSGVLEAGGADVLGPVRRCVEPVALVVERVRRQLHRRPPTQHPRQSTGNPNANAVDTFDNNRTTSSSPRRNVPTT